MSERTPEDESVAAAPASARCQRLDRPGQLEIGAGDPARAMGRQADLEGPIAPQAEVRMVVGRLGGIGDPIEQRDGIAEVAATVRPDERVAVARPAGRLASARSTRGVVEAGRGSSDPGPCPRDRGADPEERPDADRVQEHREREELAGPDATRTSSTGSASAISVPPTIPPITIACITGPRL